MTRLAIVVVVLWPRLPLARDEQAQATIVEPVRRPAPAKHVGHAQRTSVFARATPDGLRVKMVTGD
jgi:hypothetical protein